MLTDVHMSDMDGIAPAMYVRDSHPGLPVIAINAAKEEAQLVACRRAAVVDVLHKPLAAAALDRAIRHHVAPACQMTRSGLVSAHADVPLSADRLATLARESARLMDQMSENVGMRLSDTVRAEAHAMKGAFAMIGDSAIVTRCDEIEQLARAGDASAILAKATALHEAIDASLASMGSVDHAAGSRDGQ
ncbi:response regulator [Burkholderia ubonensis]|uniref:response regulator n=1 Tax=Burkholderia ubonensis TaxID=101571 RepID=UPI00075E4093|nr:response regulator [Burkholderia ubonensis]KVZ67509.1 hypothetical protein WL19_21510 [Burkholderia ubonensis]